MTTLATTSDALDDVWERHGRSAYALACALLGNETAASEAVMCAMADVTDVGASTDRRRALSRYVYRLSQVLADEAMLPQPSPTLAWLEPLSELERTSLALCAFGGHTHRQAADLLGVPPSAVAVALTTALKAVGDPARCPSPR